MIESKASIENDGALFGVAKLRNFFHKFCPARGYCDGVEIDVLAWCGVTGETGMLFGYYGVPAGF